LLGCCWAVACCAGDHFTGGGVRRCRGHRATLWSGETSISIDPDSYITIVSCWDGGGASQEFLGKSHSWY